MPLYINHGKLHEYLGILFNVSTHSEVIITMYQYIDSIIAGVPEIYKCSSR